MHMARRKQVTPEERAAVSRALTALLDERDEFGRKKWSQQRLGIELGGLSQESVRRALNPSGVGPAIRDEVARFLELTPEELVRKYGEPEIPEVWAAALGQLGMANPDRGADYARSAHELATTVSFDTPENLDIEKAKALILGHAAARKGKALGVREVDEDEEGLPGPKGKGRK